MERFKEKNIDKIITGNGAITLEDIKKDIIESAKSFVDKTSFIESYDITNALKKKSISEIDTENDYGMETNKDAFERFGLLKKEKMIGNGSDRKVFDIGNGLVLKLAKNTRGLSQNEVENNMTNDQNFYFDTKIVPEVFEIGNDYIIVEAVKNYRKGDKETDKKIHDFIKPFKHFGIHEYDRDKGKVWEVLEEIGIASVLDYDLMWNDFKSPRNWGVDMSGNVIHLDGGSFDNSILQRHRRDNEGSQLIKQPSSRWESTSRRILKEVIEDLGIDFTEKVDRNIGNDIDSLER